MMVLGQDKKEYPFARRYDGKRPYNLKEPFRKKYKLLEVQPQLVDKLLEMGFNAHDTSATFYLKWSTSEFLTIWLPSPKIIAYRRACWSYALFFKDFNKLIKQIHKDEVSLALGVDNDK